jgi:glycosyltransferase involved in cell wall biosynthesis
VNILVSESSTTMGGQELAVLLHAEGLGKRGHSVRLILEPGSAIAELAKRKGLAVEEVSMRQARMPLAIRTFRRLLSKYRPAILHLNSSRDSWIGSIAARLINPRPRVVKTRHISAPLNRSVMTRLLYRHLFDRVIVTGGELTRRALIERDGLSPEQVVAFPIGIDVEEFHPAVPARNLRQELRLAPQHRLVGLISYLRSYKGHDYFVQAATTVLSRAQDVTFLIVGEGPEEEHIRSQIARAGLSQRVLMLGFRQDLLDVFRSLDIFVMPSVEGDTIPQVLMQAMALGLPVVSTTVGSIPDVVLDGQTGCIVPPRDASALAEKIDKLLESQDLRRALGEKARQLVVSNYSLGAMLDRLEAVYRAAAA